SPPGFFDASLTKQVTDNILEPTVEAMAKEGTLYKGVLYAGLMLATDGPKVLEFNARFGDPETQVILPRLKSDLVDIILSIIDNKLHETAVEWSNDACVGVVMASGGYPGNYKTGFAIQGLDKVHPEIMIFHAGTKRDENSQICTDGGRVLTVTARGKNMAEARMKVYENIQRIYFEDCHYRKDIAFREVN
ncbi:MAG: phosphoribosylamine--glycine ligase, partial [Chloroflexi bacterium]|nr:phosphoribosylamine--glycine ligase [Chloroflexota bacterium]